ncbi:helix-turn-helix domain-containing protein [Methylobacter sp. BlB1]|uniref:helix-turn-helix domain-containing protein n=1 Tax=Methylobacter sp. BlB1 TaxID=2785914 RepID=UPI001893F5AB|nr:helix-turn-helix transcriptional regulator [Methylobacter sp. BlB1]MBF6649521.1 helix-turn-helix transcriptional regulator [Methylobacter sp. BlB1]
MQIKSRRNEYEQIVKTLGERMKAARELCGFSQIQAASLLGYANSSKLAKVEGSIDAVPLWLIPKAAEVYRVSIDFLFGVSDCWQRDPTAAQEQHVEKWLEAHWEQAQNAQDSAIQTLHDKQVELKEAIDRTLRRSKENFECVKHVRQNNKVFDSLRGGAKLLRVLAETAEEAMGLDYELRKLREAELVIDEVLQDPRHPVNDRNHLDHCQAKKALDELKSKADQSRANTEVKRFYQSR